MHFNQLLFFGPCYKKESIQNHSAISKVKEAYHIYQQLRQESHTCTLLCYVNEGALGKLKRLGIIGW